MTTENALIPAPMQLFVIPRTLNGVTQANRAPAFITQQIATTNDIEAIQSWLAEFSSSSHTQRSYRKEAERSLLWSLIEKQKLLSSLTRDETSCASGKR